jgi:hypothetical protein
VGDATITTDAAAAARIAELEAALAAHETALAAERALREGVEAERDRLREAYEALKREVELARRRLVVAKAERIDTTQLELEFAAKLAALDELDGKAEDDEIGEHPKPERDASKKKHGRRDLRLCDLPEERIEIPDPLLDGKAARIGTEESTGLRWKRGGFVRVVFVRFKYSTSAPAIVKTSTVTSDVATDGDQPAPEQGPNAKLAVKTPHVFLVQGGAAPIRAVGADRVPPSPSRTGFRDRLAPFSARSGEASAGAAGARSCARCPPSRCPRTRRPRRRGRSRVRTRSRT